MLLILHPDTDPRGEAYRTTLQHLQQLPGIAVKRHLVQGQQQTLTELYLIGDTHALDRDELAMLPAVERVVRISEETGLDGDAVLRVAEARGVKPLPRGKGRKRTAPSPNRRYRDEQLADAVRLYEQGMLTLAGIAAATDVPRPSLYAALRARGIEPSRRRRPVET